MANRTERDKMLAGDLYSADDPELTQARMRARRLMRLFNASREDELELRASLLRELCGNIGANVWIEPPFYCDYGSNIYFGDNIFIVRIGSNAQIATNVQILTAYHPVAAAERIRGPELASPVTIGENVWLGSGVIICPGLTIGDNTTIGAGSVVVDNIPANVLAVGNPCRVVKRL